MMKSLTRGLLAATVIAGAASFGYACDDHAKASDAKDAEAPKAAATSKAAGCDMPCCAHAADVADAKAAAAPVPAVAAADKPCAAHDGKACPKKAAAMAKAQPAKEAPKAEPVADAGTHR
jgi:hypothetical protein